MLRFTQLQNLGLQKGRITFKTMCKLTYFQQLNINHLPVLVFLNYRFIDKFIIAWKF